MVRAFAYMTQLLETFRSERKFSAIQLCILSHNTPAKALYQSLGFVETGENTMKMKLYCD
ncbi:TPA: N-acetyltransferase family protein [Streptococcus suis]